MDKLKEMTEELKKITEHHTNVAGFIFGSITGALCKHCEGSGEVTVANGEEDFDTDYCNCQAGQTLMAQHEEDLKEKHEN